MGHATRCIPIIKTLQSQGHTIVVATNKKQKEVLSIELDNIDFILSEGYNIKYSKSRFLFGLKIVAQAPKILFKIYHEHQWLNKLIDEKKIDLVISDNRFGLFTKKIPCIFITHQLTIKAPFKWLEKLIQKINYAFINQFNQCWVPDVIGKNNLAGELSHPIKLPKTPVIHIGILSRFQQKNEGQKIYDVCILLSGPEPQRTLLEEKLVNQISNISHLKIIIIRGLPSTSVSLNNSSFISKNYLSQRDLQDVICSSEVVISRSGYTTVMELLSLHKKSILIPTPGQTEQEYLANYLQDKKYCLSFSQECFDLAEVLKHSNSFDYNLSTEFEYYHQKLIEQLNKLLT